MVARLAIALLVLLAPVTAHAEQVVFDYRLYPALDQSMQQRGNDAIYYENAWPNHILDRIVVRGKGPLEWTEAMEIVVLPLPRQPGNPQNWLDAYRAGEDATCPSSWAVIAQDDNSITFERSAAQCPGLAGQVRLYRTIKGKKNLFMLGGFSRDGLSDAARSQWLAMLASAAIKP